MSRGPEGEEAFFVESETASQASMFANLSPEDRAALYQLFETYLRENPDVVSQALQVTRAQAQARSNQSIPVAIQALEEQIYEDPNTPVRGGADADVTIVEFFDYRCGYCRRAHPVLDTLLASDPKIRIVYKEYPILGEISLLAAQAALAARHQGKYAEFHDLLYQEQGARSSERLFQVAAQAGLDIERLRADMQDPDIMDALVQNRDLGRALNVTGTPTFVIGDRIIQGFVNLDAMQQAVAQARAAQAAAAAQSATTEPADVRP
ncbi:MAG: DsbA family protein [Parvularculaceae bacterium]